MSEEGRTEPVRDQRSLTDQGKMPGAESKTKLNWLALPLGLFLILCFALLGVLAAIISAAVEMIKDIMYVLIVASLLLILFPPTLAEHIRKQKNSVTKGV